MMKLPAKIRWILIICGGVLVFLAALSKYVAEDVASYFGFIVFPYSWVIGLVLFIVGYGLTEYSNDGHIPGGSDQTPGFNSRKDGFFDGGDFGSGDGGGGGGDG